MVTLASYDKAGDENTGYSFVMISELICDAGRVLLLCTMACNGVLDGHPLSGYKDEDISNRLQAEIWLMSWANEFPRPAARDATTATTATASRRKTSLTLTFTMLQATLITNTYRTPFSI